MYMNKRQLLGKGKNNVDGKVLITINYFGKMESGVLHGGRRGSLELRGYFNEPLRTSSLGGATLASGLACR